MAPARLPGPSALKAFAVPVLAVSAAAALRWALGPMLREQLPLLVFVIPVTIASYVGGWWSGVLATVLSLIAGGLLFIQPFAGFGAPVELLRAAVFVAAGLLLSGLIEALHRARRPRWRKRLACRQSNPH
jgi:K+-sensing histidine kinase KdpD